MSQFTKKRDKKKKKNDPDNEEPPLIYTVFKSNKRCKKIFYEWYESTKNLITTTQTHILPSSDSISPSSHPPSLTLQQFTSAIRLFLSSNYQSNLLNDDITDEGIKCLYHECISLDQNFYHDPNSLTLPYFVQRMGVQKNVPNDLNHSNHPNPPHSASSQHTTQPTLTLQSPRTGIHSTMNHSSITPDHILTILHSLYLDGERHYRNVDLTNVAQNLKNMKPQECRKLVNSILEQEGIESHQQQRNRKLWAARPLDRGGVTLEEIQSFYTWYDGQPHHHVTPPSRSSSSSGIHRTTTTTSSSASAGGKRSGNNKSNTNQVTLDMTQIFEQSKSMVDTEKTQRKSTASGGKKLTRGVSSKSRTPSATSRKKATSKKKKKEDKSSTLAPHVTTYTLKSVKPEHLTLWFTDVCFREYFLKLNKSSEKGFYKVYPPLTHWGTVDQGKYSLAKGESGYQIPLVMSHYTKIKLVVRDGSDGRQGHDQIYVYGSIRTEYVSLCAVEELYHCCVVMDEDENVVNVICKVKRRWLDGEMDQIGSTSTTTTPYQQKKKIIDELQSDDEEEEEQEGGPSISKSKKSSSSHGVGGVDVLNDGTGDVIPQWSVYLQGAGVEDDEYSELPHH